MGDHLADLLARDAVLQRAPEVAAQLGKTSRTWLMVEYGLERAAMMGLRIFWVNLSGNER